MRKTVNFQPIYHIDRFNFFMAGMFEITMEHEDLSTSHFGLHHHDNPNCLEI
jgi:hypothetical protein